jgi:hypothetical protein
MRDFPRGHCLEPFLISAKAIPWLSGLLAALSAASVLVFLFTAAHRLHFPFEYDWVEDGMLSSVRRIRCGLPLYSPPSVYFTPYLYTPIYLYAAAGISRLAGTGYPALRLLSILSTLGCFGLLYGLVYAEVRRRLSAIAAVGFFAACYPVVQGSFDVGRVDMLYLFFVLSAFFATRRLNPVVAALLWVCAFQTKQGVLPIALLALCYDWQRPRRILLGLSAFVLGMAASILWLTHLTDGWYRYYVFGLAGGFGYSVHQAVHFIPVDLLGASGIALVVIAAALFCAPPEPRSRALSFYVLGSIGMIGFSGYLRAHRGANVNSLLPMYAWIALLFGLSLGRLSGLLEARGSATANAALATLLLAASAQLAQHYYSPNEFRPSPDMLAERNAFEQQVRSIPGDVLISSHPEDGLLAGKPLFAGSESVGAVLEAKNEAEGDKLMEKYSELLHGGYLHAVVVDDPAEQILAYPRVWMPRDFLALYPLRVAAIGGEDNYTVSEPRWIYLPCASRDIAFRLDPRVDTTRCATQ